MKVFGKCFPTHTTSHFIWNGLSSENGIVSPHQELDMNDHYLNFGSNGRIYKGTYHLSQYDKPEKVIDVAVKKVKASKNTHRELENLIELRSESEIIHFYNYYEKDKTALIVTELCEGGDLSDFLIDERRDKGKKLTVDETRRVIKWLLKAVQKCHSHRICHGDIKLENIGLLKKGNLDELKLLDLGNGKKIDDSTTFSRSELLGSPRYIPPELLGNPNELLKSEDLFPLDIWCIGISMYCMLTGTFPRKQKYRLSEKTYGAECVDLLSKLLRTDPKDRITISEALLHPFLS